MHKRTEIRKYMIELVKAAIKFDKVYGERPNALHLDKVPCALVYWTGEGIEIEDGDNYCVSEYERDLTVNVDIMTLEGEDRLDELCEALEYAFSQDWFLGKAAPDYNPEKPRGLCKGMTLGNAIPYTVTSESGHDVYGTRTVWSVPYLDDATSKRKGNSFSEYNFEITTTNGAETAGEGSL